MASPGLYLMPILFILIVSPVESDIGVNWGRLSNKQLSTRTIVKLLIDNKINKVKLFDFEHDVLKALMGTGIETTVGIPNGMLSIIAYSPSAADAWVAKNLTKYIGKGGVDIRYVAVGIEPFTTSYSSQYQSLILPALNNLQRSLSKKNLAGTVKLVVPCNANTYESLSVPSLGSFRQDLTQTMTDLLSFLNSNGSPFVVNIYAFLSLYGNPNFPQDYAFFFGTAHPLEDGKNVYNNASEANVDTLVSALSRLGFGEMPIVIGEIGWPTDGANSANITAAYDFNQGLIYHILGNKGTPLRPRVPWAPTTDVYIFSLIDEDAKSLLPGDFERHWGIFDIDGKAKYPLDFKQSKGPNLVNANGQPSLFSFQTKWIIIALMLFWGFWFANEVIKYICFYPGFSL